MTARKPKPAPPSNGFRKPEQTMREGDVPLSDHELGDLRMSLMGHVMTGSEKDEAIKLFLCLTNELIERRRDAELFAKLERVAEDVIATRDQRKRYAEELQKDAFLEPKA